jgi:hypothetical protein
VRPDLWPQIIRQASSTNEVRFSRTHCTGCSVAKVDSRPLRLTRWPWSCLRLCGHRTACRLTRQPRQAVVPGLPGAAQLVWAKPSTACRLTRQPRQAVVPGLPGAAQLLCLTPSDLPPIGLTEPFGLRQGSRTAACRLTRQPRQAVVPGLPGAAQLVWATPSDLPPIGITESSTECRLTRQPRQAIVTGLPGAAQLVWATPSDLPPIGLTESSTECRLTGLTARSAAAAAPQSLSTATCYQMRLCRIWSRNAKTRSSNDCNCSFCHGILQKTGRVRVHLNSEHREGLVAIGPDAV